jgi:hypothetical protein
LLERRFSWCGIFCQGKTGESVLILLPQRQETSGNGAEYNYR